MCLDDIIIEFILSRGDTLVCIQIIEVLQVLSHFGALWPKWAKMCTFCQVEGPGFESDQGKVSEKVSVKKSWK